MKVTKLTWLSKAALEAELIVSDGVHECMVFSQPCKVKLHQSISEPLYAFDVEKLMKVNSDSEKEIFKKNDESYFSYSCVAKVVSIEKSIVSIGNILIKLEGGIPRWAKEGDIVEFQCGRFDIF